MKAIKQWDKQFMLILAVILYSGIFLLSPETAHNSLAKSWEELQTLLIPITAAMFVGGTIKILLDGKDICSLFQGKKTVLTSTIVGSLLPPCPFTAYPVVRGFKDGGVKLPGIITMLVASTIVELGTVFAGLAVFGARIMSLRIGFAFLATFLTGLLINQSYRLYSKLKNLLKIT